MALYLIVGACMQAEFKRKVSVNPLKVQKGCSKCSIATQIEKIGMKIML